MVDNSLNSKETDIIVKNGKKSEKISNNLVFYVNGVEVRENQAQPEWTLLYYLRNKLGLVGTKLGCAEGGCGACTIMISKYDRERKKIINFSANACLMPLCAIHGLSVTTVEGIGSTRTKLHPVQERIAKAHGSQCGFCTPGMVMSMYSLLRSNSNPKMENLKSALDGNLCRCTGYRPILEGFKTFTDEWKESLSLIKNGTSNDSVCPMGENCCKRAFTSEPNELFDSNAFRPYDPTQEPIFPPKLMISSVFDEEYLIIKGKNVTWYRPNNLQNLLILKNRFPNSKIVVGNTEIGVEVKYKNCHYPIFIQPSRIKEMNEIIECKELHIGASITLSDLEDLLKHQIKINEESKTKIFKSIINMLHRFAGLQIRNVASIGGNIITSSPISDLNPLFIAAGVKLKVASLRLGFRTISMDHLFMTGYRTNLVEPDEVLVSIAIPFSHSNQYFVAYKQSRRRDDDIAIVNMALNLFFTPSKEKEVAIVQNANLVFGGMGPTTIVAKKTSESLIGEKWNRGILDKTYNNLLKEFSLSDDAPGGMVSYRKSLALSLFFKAFTFVENQLESIQRQTSLKQELAFEEFVFKDPTSSQYFQVVPNNQSSWDLIGKPVVHSSAMKQATGEALYCDDVQQFRDEVHLAFVLSTKAHANILKIDPSDALALNGVIAFFDASDINSSETEEDRNIYELIARDEPIFARKTVFCQGRPIGAIVAIDQLTAQKAAAIVKVEYETLSPIITIEDAITHKSFFSPPTIMISGKPVEAFEKADHVLMGEIRIGGQEHFYLETQATVAIPRDGDQLEVFCSTQNPSEVQKLIARLLGLPSNKITIRVPRIGGGFGGKDTRASMVALPVAYVAYKLQKPVRCMLDRSEDMMMTGNRHPFLHKYKIGFDNSGLIKVVEVEMYLNAGCTLDVSGAVLERGMFHFENSYKIPSSKITGYLCKTNLPSNVAFRGFGGPQSMFLAENMIRDVAEFLRRDEMDLIEMNFYKEGDVTHYNQRLDYCTLERCWQECLRSSDFRRRQHEIAEFNKSNRYRKRGISVVSSKHGIAFSEQFLNQGGALVNVYLDGSVLITHGGVEMGQGLHTKMIQVASRVLQLDSEKISIGETSTDKIPNTTTTGSSISSDMYGMAVLEACEEIMRRIKPVIDDNPTASWEKWISEAYLRRIQLSATGFHKTPDVGYCRETNSGMLYHYFTYGVACSEVKIDCLTGDHQVLRTDIVMDLGESLNPAIDIGQVEGAFLQGYGLFTLEEIVYSREGSLLSRGPGTYKIPGFSDIPQQFNVSLLKGAPNPRTIYSSKAVGEPPLFLASSVFFAIKEAIKSARNDSNIVARFQFDSPATAEKIRMACEDQFTSRIKSDGKKAWNVVP
ncbi:xanthine dehydrogenase-like [Leptopilina boulardi]|uniref:xanthine dehydrogenase-like n=1 Tax=Leptopilina boulardi TaxID=63433 RepID=UPI0021F5C7A9|nr:xanthine dehydrogenase-like [Leptopilina boulardi]